ncbi:MAG: hypothetical protein LBH43_01405 [Treponema sp.]|jgi:hypothetical protein|nr:hypothetical protein [Treponema sp.]
MKKLLFVFIFSVFFGYGLFAEGQSQQDAVRKEANQQSAIMQQAAQSAIPVPYLSYFQERRTVSKWATHWDKPSAACYVYLISYGTIIGYYVSDGKPASTGSFLTPEYREETIGNGGVRNIQLPDIDGCYGTNNQGIRFFTASGIAVEWAGSGASYIYSDVPLQISVPLLGK